jgi:hypothetical protein
VSKFVRGAQGTIAKFSKSDAAALTNLAGQLIAMLEDRATEDRAVESAAGSPANLLFTQLGIGGSDRAPGDPALARLLPDAYRNDESAASEHRHLTELGLVERKAANARVVITSLETNNCLLDSAAVQSWLRTLTDLRLIVATRLQITEDGDEGIGDEVMLEVYEWLGYVQGTLLGCIDL